jgi:hypothetical protein
MNLHTIILEYSMKGMKTRTRRSKVPEATMAGLTQWYKSAFERLGWMVLAKEHGMKDKVVCYQKEIQRLHESLCVKIQHVFDEDKRQDLMIMKTNVECLIDHANKDFK